MSIIQKFYFNKYWLILLFSLSLLREGMAAENHKVPSAIAKVVNKNSSMFIQYKTIRVDSLEIFYREAGSPSNPTILFLHGFPSSSKMYQGLFPYLASHYHLVAPDYPGFGFSESPAANKFAYTFDHLSRVMADFTEAIGLKSYVLFMQDYGGPVGFRLAVAYPEKVKAMVIQNAVVHEEGLSELWVARKAFWNDRAAHEAALKKNFTSFDATRQRHIGTNPNPERLDPDTWTDEYAFLNRPGESDIQIDLFYDYRTNVASYSKWQTWLKQHQPPLLVLWGKYDPSFTVAGAEAYKKDVPDCEVHIFDAGHFATFEIAPEMAGYTERFLKSKGI